MKTTKTIDRIRIDFSKLYQTKKWENITISELCQYTGLSRATFYTYYENIECLLDEIESMVLEDISNILDSWRYLDLAHWDDKVPAPVYIDIYRYVVANKEIFKAVFGEFGDVRFVDQYPDIDMKYFLHIARTSSTITKDHELIAAMCSGSIFGLGRIWIQNMSLASVEDLALLNTRVVNGIIFRFNYSGAQSSEP